MDMREIHKILESIRDMIIEKRKEVNISSISSCLRMSYYRATESYAVTEKMIMGSENHAFFERHFARLMEERGYVCTPEKEVEIEGVRGRVDLYCEKDDVVFVFEFKFTSHPYASNLFFPFWERQLRYYTAAVMSERGDAEVRGYLVASNFEVTQWLIHEVRDADLEQVRREVAARASALRAAYAGGGPPPAEKGPWCGRCAFRVKCFSQQLL